MTKQPAAVEAPPVAGPRVPRRYEWTDLPADAYPGFQVKLWITYPQRFVAELQSGDTLRILEVLRQVVIEHNGWCDEEGAPYPPASDPTFWDAIPLNLGIIVVAVLQREATALPNSMTPKSTR